MKKTILIGVIAVVLVAALGVAGLAYAQTPNPPAPNTPFEPGWGRGHMGGGMGMMGRRGSGGYGPMHEYMEEAFAEALGVKVEDLEAALEEGQTMWQFAESKGFTQEQFLEAMSKARQDAIAKMVAAGVITKEQGDWMLSRMQNMWGQGGFDGCPGMGGGYGGRWGNSANPPASGPSSGNF